MTSHHSERDHVFAALAHHRRRATLECLQHHQEMALADLADELAVREHGMTIDGIPPDTVRECYLSLYHCHIPKLADAHLVQYDQDTDLVAITDHGKTAVAWLADDAPAPPSDRATE